MVRFPDTFIIGAPKSGRTSLYEYLKGHPDVFMSVVKETPLSPALRRRLEDEFAPDVARLSEMLGRDLGALWFGRSVMANPAAEKRALAVS